MTHPFQPAGQPGEDAVDQNYVGTSFDEIESRVGLPDPTTPQAPDLSVKLDGDAIPEEFRGLTLDQMLQRAKGQVEVIKRFGRGESAPPPQPTPTPAAQPTAPQPLPQISENEFRELYDKDPAAAIAAVTAVTEQRMLRFFDDRIQPLLGNHASSAEFQARQQFPDEFKLFENEIKAAAAQVPNKAALASPEGWAALVKYVRGDNIDKLIEYRMSQKAGGDTQVDPRTRAAETTLEGVTPAPAPSPTNGRPRTSTKGYSGPLSDEQREIMKVMGIDEAEYRANYI
jgi:hypothetical protein